MHLLQLMHAHAASQQTRGSQDDRHGGVRVWHWEHRGESTTERVGANSQRFEARGQGVIQTDPATTGAKQCYGSFHHNERELCHNTEPSTATAPRIVIQICPQGRTGLLMSPPSIESNADRYQHRQVLNRCFILMQCHSHEAGTQQRVAADQQGLISSGAPALDQLRSA
jgi:hypothetical protein